MILVENVKLNIGYADNDILIECAKKLNISKNDILNYSITKKSIDARRKPSIYYVLNVAVELNNKLEQKFLKYKIEINNDVLNFSTKKIKNSPVVVGFGPAGMFCGLMLARMGLKPIIVEQGEDVDNRLKSVDNFWKNRKLNKYSNVQFGEGGAGTFSDGKLNTNLSSRECKIVLNELHHFGAPDEILYTSKPHIGSDNLKNIVKNIRKEIINLGGKVLFSTKMESFNCVGNCVSKVNCFNVEDGLKISFETEHLILALGHSARDTFEYLNLVGVEMRQKPFAMGVRIEQLQEDINHIQYGANYDKRLPNADYKLVSHLPNGRSVFTFCMCPGGYVVASSSQEGEIVTNGMSNFSRNNKNANSALLVNVLPKDFGADDALAGIRFQQKYERLAYECGGSNYDAPFETVETFLKNVSLNKKIDHSYLPGIKFSKLEKCLPNFVIESLKLGIVDLNKRVNGFAKDEDLLIGIESRSSCPLTIVRDENFEASIKGVYPIGEGAGYAGGIVSSALDGIKIAKRIYENI